MKTHLRRIGVLGILFSFILIISISGCTSRKDVDKPYIRTLDSLLKQADEFQLQRLKGIEELKQKKRMAKNLSELYLYNNLLFENFYTLNADSAVYYANQSLRIAKESGNKEWITQSTINKSAILAATGLLKGALELMDKINPDELSNEVLIDYYGQMIFLYSRLGNYTGGAHNNYYVVERLYKDSIMSVIPPNHPDYLWYKGWDILGTNQKADSIIVALKERLDTTAMDDRHDAKNAYILARLYEQIGDMDNFEKYMTLSAIIDVKIANAEISSLEDLSRYMFADGKGDIDRANSYIHYSLQKALDYPNRSRALGLSDSMEKINSVYHEKLLRQNHVKNLFLVLTCVLSLILGCAVVAIVLQKKKVDRQRREVDNANEELNQKVLQLKSAEGELNRINSQLQELNADLQKKNEELHEANYVKEEYLGYVFKLCSTYIDRIENFKRSIYLKAMKKQWKDIEFATSDWEMKDEIKEFYHSFDTIFLHIYPNFVEDFNSMLKEDKKIHLKEGELLNMELRIYALVRLGINDSVKIADFLHCAPQTVYNYRLRARSRSKYDKETFLDKIKSISHFDG